MRIPGNRVLRTAALIAIAAGVWLTSLAAPELCAAERGREPRAGKAPMVVSITDLEIVTTSPKGEVARVRWSALTKVVLRTTDAGPFLPDIFWLLYAGGDKPALVVVGGAEGDQELVVALQKRLPGFNNDNLIQAMQTTDNHLFLLWEKAATPPAAGVKTPPH